MNFADFNVLLARGEPLRYDAAAFTDVGGQIAVEGRLAIPLVLVSPAHDPSDDLEVFDEVGNLLGLICFVHSRGIDIEITTLTDWQYVAYLAEIPTAQFGQPRRFERDYLVLEPGVEPGYRQNYLATAPLWGGIVHDGLPILAAPVRTALPRLVAIAGLQYPTQYHQETAIRGIRETYAFERYLKLYHLLELLLDYDIVQRIRSLGNNLEGVGKLLSEYQSQDLPRLKKTIQERCTRIAEIERALSAVVPYAAIARTIFQEFGKDGNPLNAFQGAFERVIIQGGFSFGNQHLRLPADRGKYDQLLLDIAAYWLFRIRCCVAHNRIGEYVMVQADEEFVARFAEPLAQTVILDAFRTPLPPLPAPAIFPPILPPDPAYEGWFHRLRYKIAEMICNVLRIS